MQRMRELSARRVVTLLALACGVIALGFSANRVLPQSLKADSSQEERIDCVSQQVEGITYCQVARIITGEVGKVGSHEDIVLFLDDQQFSEDSVLRIFQHVNFAEPDPTTLHVTLLTNRQVLLARRKNGVSHASVDTIFSRLTGQPNECCPPGFKGAQFDRHVSGSNILVCNDGKSKQFVLEKDESNTN